MTYPPRKIIHLMCKQALLACPPFYNLMKALPSKMQQSSATTTKSTTPMIDSVVEFINEFTPLEMMNKNQKKDKARKKEDLPTGNALEPSYVYRTLLQLESETFKVVEGRQEDAEEFLTCMLNMISDEMSSLLKLTEVQQGQEGGEESSEGGPEWQEVTARGRSCITRYVPGFYPRCKTVDCWITEQIPPAGPMNYFTGCLVCLLGLGVFRSLLAL